MMREKSSSRQKMSAKEADEMSVPSETEDGDATVQEQRYSFAEGCEMASDLAAKLEKVQTLPILKDPRIVNLVAKFSDFP